MESRDGPVANEVQLAAVRLPQAAISRHERLWNPALESVLLSLWDGCTDTL
jgi:hypothetical protein